LARTAGQRRVGDWATAKAYQWFASLGTQSGGLKGSQGILKARWTEGIPFILHIDYNFLHSSSMSR
jgi:hypothetical protein